MGTDGLKGAIIGTGEQARWQHRHAWKPTEGVTPVACFDLNAEAARRFADEVGLVAYPSIGTMMEEARPDLVGVSTPPGAHAGNVTAILDAARALGLPPIGL